jgi:aspartyl-tRNA(Asn)/glutamyl-tRNA(Gln) amidotransferase subunit B
LKDKKIPYSKIDNKILDLIIKMINLISQNKLNKKQAKLLFPEMIETLKDPELLMEEKGFIQIVDKSIITELLKKIINENKSMLDQYNSRKERVLKFYMGLLMSKTKGQANPIIANEILTQIIQEFIKK